MNNQQIENAVKKFSDLIERSKELRAYSEFKEGVNEGLEIAKDTFDENVEKFILSYSDEDRTAKIKSLQDQFDVLIDTLVITRKPQYNEEFLEGLNEGLEQSKEIFRNFVKEFYNLD